MKKVFISSFIVALSLLIIPFKNIKSNSDNVLKASAKAENITETEESVPEENITFRIKTDAGIIVLSKEDYIVGVVAAEMPASYGIEALKAQSVAAYSFALYRKNSAKDREYDLTDSYKTDQSYLNDDALKEKWGDSYTENINKIRQAVKEVSGEYLSFEGKPALTLYHSVSSGITNSCKDVFGGDMPYLVSVLCEEDKLSSDYKSVFSFSEDELKDKLANLCGNAKSGENMFESIKTAKSGFVKEIKCAGAETSGSEVAGLLSLPSATFTVEFNENAYTFYCLGRGHGVGMSQYAAGRMAENGSDYKEILKRFYPGTELQKK